MKPQFRASNQSQGWIASALVTLAALFSAVGIGTGDVPRVLRNHPAVAGITFGAVILAAVLVVIAGWFVKKATAERWLVRSATGALVVAAGFAFWTGVSSARERPEPAITAQILTDSVGSSTLKFAVKDSGLRSRDRMTVLILARPEANNDERPPLTTLYAAALGPDSSGNVDHAGEVALPPAPDNEVEVQAWVGRRHSCDDVEIASAGCIKLHINRLFEKPQLSIKWADLEHRRAELTVQLGARDLALHRVVLRILGTYSHHVFTEATWPSNAEGDVAQSITVTIPASARRLCIAASTTEASPSCEVPPGSGNAAVVTDIPSE